MAATRPRTLPLLQPQATSAAATSSSVAETSILLDGEVPTQDDPAAVGPLDGGAHESLWDDVKIHPSPHDHVLLGGTAIDEITSGMAATSGEAMIQPGSNQQQQQFPASAPGNAKPRRYLPANKKPPGPPQVIEEYPARLFFRGCLCLSGDPYVADDLATHNLFHYTSSAYKDHIVRFDPNLYPVEGGLEGPGAVRLIRDVKNCYLENLNLHRGAPHLKDQQRRLFCLRGDVRKSSHIVQTCRCNVHLIIRSDAHSHFLKGGKGCATHAGHARIVDLAKFRPLPAILTPKEVAATGEVMEGYHPDHVVVVEAHLVPPASIQAGSDEIVSYPARVAFEAAPCLLDEPFGRSKLTMLELYSYTHPRFKHMVVRFDPLKYPTENGFDGDGWKALMADLKDKSEDPLCLHSVAAQDRDRLRRLCCRRGQMHHAKFVVQTCHCPVRLLIHKDDQTFYLKCGEGGSVHQGHPPLPKVYSQKGIPKRKHNPDGTHVGSGEAGAMGAAAAAAATKVEDEPLILPPSKTAKRLWPYVTQLVEALEGQPWQKVDAAGKKVQAITDAILQRKRDRDEQGDPLPSRKHQGPAGASLEVDDDAINHHHYPHPHHLHHQIQVHQPQAQQASQMLLQPPHGPPHHHHQAVYQPFPSQQNLYWL